MSKRAGGLWPKGVLLIGSFAFGGVAQVLLLLDARAPASVYAANAALTAVLAVLVLIAAECVALAILVGALRWTVRVPGSVELQVAIGLLTAASIALFCWYYVKYRSRVRRTERHGRGRLTRQAGFPFDRPVQRDIAIFWPWLCWATLLVGGSVLFLNDFFHDPRSGPVLRAVVVPSILLIGPLFLASAAREVFRSSRRRTDTRKGFPER